MDHICPWENYDTQTSQCSATDANGPIRVATAADGLPPAMQGVFWLTEQGDSSALMSFAPSKDGGGLSTFTMTPSDGYHFKIRVGGDRVWSFHDQATSWELVEGLDLIYNFRMEDANGEAPSTVDDIAAAQIIPSAENLNGLELDAPSASCLLPPRTPSPPSLLRASSPSHQKSQSSRGALSYNRRHAPPPSARCHRRSSRAQVLNFRAELATAGSHSKYNTSVVWGRPSAVFGFEGGYYDLVQVMDGEGNNIEPAFSDWVSYCNDAAQTGDSPGAFHYKVAQ